jgi:teichuronic acid biosynthesis glycosyltransferase TuaC
MRVVVVAEYYPRAAEPELGVWAHRQAVAARDAGAEVEVLVLHRPVPSRAALRTRDLRAVTAPLRQPLHGERDGIRITYVPFLAPPRPRSYTRWGAYAAPTLKLALRRRHFDLVHAHYAMPAGDAVRRTGARYVVSVHGGDLLAHGGAPATRAGLEGARLVLANSSAMAERALRLGARRARVVHLGADLPAAPVRHRAETLVTVGNLVERKRHADVLRALWLMRDTHPHARYVVAGDGPERPRLERLAHDLGLADRVEFAGAVPHPEAVATAQSGAVFVLPSVDEAFGVAYVEALAGGVPTIGCRREPGPEDLHALTDAMRLVAPGDPEGLARTLAALLDDEPERLRLGAAARTAVSEHLTWEACGRATVAAYEAALA